MQVRGCVCMFGEHVRVRKTRPQTPRGGGTTNVAHLLAEVPVGGGRCRGEGGAARGGRPGGSQVPRGREWGASARAARLLEPHRRSLAHGVGHAEALCDKRRAWRMGWGSLESGAVREGKRVTLAAPTGAAEESSRGGEGPRAGRENDLLERGRWGKGERGPCSGACATLR